MLLKPKHQILHWVQSQNTPIINIQEKEFIALIPNGIKRSQKGNKGSFVSRWEQSTQQNENKLNTQLSGF